MWSRERPGARLSHRRSTAYRNGRVTLHSRVLTHACIRTRAATARVRGAASRTQYYHRWPGKAAARARSSRLLPLPGLA